MDLLSIVCMVSEPTHANQSGTIILFTCATPHIKSKRVPDQRFTHLLLLSARVLPRTKSKGLHRYVL
jgi:hypothetical protein